MKKNLFRLLALLFITSMSLSGCGSFVIDDTLQISTILTSVDENGKNYIVIYFEDGTVFTQEVPKGETGENGNGISKIEKDEEESTQEVSVYTIYFTDGTSTTFSINNGKGIEKINVLPSSEDGTIYIQVQYDGDYNGDGIKDVSEPFPIPRGYSVIVGENDPSSETVAKNNDSYINYKTGDMFLKTNDQWILVGNIKGNSVYLNKGTPLETGAKGKEGDIYIDLNTYNIYVRTSSGWVNTPVGNIRGNSVYTGKGTPSNELGKEGDIYIDLNTYNIYACLDTGWKIVPEGNIKGNSVYTGKGTPSNELGKEGDIYIDLNTYDMYKKSETGWDNDAIGNIRGNSLFAGNGNPNTNEYKDIGKEGDTYLDVDTSDVYKRSSEGWGDPIGNIRGQGIIDVYFNDEGKLVIVYEKDEDGKPTIYEEVDFPHQNALLSGNGSPSNSMGKSGDLYYDKQTNKIYIKEGNSWTVLIDLSVNEEEYNTYYVTFKINAPEVNGTYFEGDDVYKNEKTIGIGDGFDTFYEARKNIPVPHREGYVFGGWYTTNETPSVTNGMFTDLTPIYCDMVLYAHWIEA